MHCAMRLIHPVDADRYKDRWENKGMEKDMEQKALEQKLTVFF